jgi:hypothetical protein
MLMISTGKNNVEFIGDQNKITVSLVSLIGTVYILMNFWEPKKDFASLL